METSARGAGRSFGLIRAASFSISSLPAQTSGWQEKNSASSSGARAAPGNSGCRSVGSIFLEFVIARFLLASAEVKRCAAGPGSEFDEFPPQKIVRCEDFGLLQRADVVGLHPFAEEKGHAASDGFTP